ncbi:MAG: histone deacetylase family protein [Rhodobacteraceae bacterium]|nr:histone deacetylase family protein [Paracoccaceae bacterium]
MDIIHTEAHRRRNPSTELYGGELVRPFECPERVDHILKEIAARALGPVSAPRDFGLEPVRRVHDGAYLDFLESCWTDWRAAGYQGEAIASCWPSRAMTRARPPREIDGKIGYYALAGETSISEGTWEAARASADVALTGQARLAEGARTAFALCRPPGHHAARDMFGGYCFLNNAAIAAQAMIDAGATRVAVLDVDFHHGNGTQAIFYDRADVMFLSLHGDPDEAFPYFLGGADETGEGAGKGFTVNYPMPSGTGYAEWSRALQDALTRLSAYAPSALVVSLGVDAFKQDPISFFTLESADFTDMGRRIAGLGAPTLFVMEGGYAVAEIGVNAVNVLAGFEQGPEL